MIPLCSEILKSILTSKLTDFNINTAHGVDLIISLSALYMGAVKHTRVSTDLFYTDCYNFTLDVCLLGPSPVFLQYGNM